jgi:hypothetical protein
MSTSRYSPLRRAYRGLHSGSLRFLARLGFNVARSADFYSPLPVLEELEKNRRHWDHPSELVGVEYDLDAMRGRLERLVGAFGQEFLDLAPYEEIKGLGYGPGFPVLDAMLTYMMVRRLRPARYIEIGSGLSTYYSWLAAERNREDGAQCELTCIDPFPTGKLWSLDHISAIESKVEEVDLAVFDQLGPGDVLFIDSTHVVRVGGDVAFLFLEVLPRLRPGVVFHVHDIPFPYNTPYPADEYLFGAKWPLYRTEQMILQAFLAFNREFEVLLSTPMLRHFDEGSLSALVPGYRSLTPEDWDTHFGSFWGRRVDGDDPLH